MSLDEFVASFQALIPQDTPGWATASSSVAGGTGRGSGGVVRTKTVGGSPETRNFDCCLWAGSFVLFKFFSIGKGDN